MGRLLFYVFRFVGFFDGKIARHFHQVTEWGKMLDPIADKLTQAALAIMCTVHFPATIWLFLYGTDGITCDSKEKSGFWCQAVWKNWYGRLGFWDFSTYFIPRHASFSIEFIDSGTDDFNGCHLILYLRFHIELLTNKTFGKNQKTL